MGRSKDRRDRDEGREERRGSRGGLGGAPLKPYHEMLVGELREGLSAFQRPTLGLAVSSLSAGIDLGFSILLVAAVHTLLEAAGPPSLRLLTAAVYPVGFIFVILGRAELFTEQTTLAILPVLHGQAKARALARLWAIVYASNLVGITIMATLLAVTAPRLGVASSESFAAIARSITAHPWWLMVLSAMLTGWLMGLLSWLLTATRDTISQIALVWAIAAVIGFSHLHHSIVGVGEVVAGAFSGAGLTPLEIGRFVIAVTAGNVAGGFVFAVVLKVSGGIRGARLERLGSEDAGRPEEPRES
jgi:formate-nitrite transporter family protein